mmetsp:Transcript_35281/g.43550  ORF Transcript_35281/g.43550 Transcript_35281/m.43550 type:complete len:331 (+) Transcript_35281:322-1314(+)|eukprot:CAMPEP_0204835930 /NCGR_PEP_ID=MMETSP1346-20131115/24048_1 /ASSEMBLY_ACC=CAM_ASM_000771 /TAXON_ID=215587 /ORGANISM="Aplanochytrium stocchinoi, Strain GSBS06" /LENGTH=330 /DNA_ID=CAMNT_0051970359 /DNA_START=233 /DNA_END=1225 /DNA_ORIENTATION=-
MSAEKLSDSKEAENEKTSTVTEPESEKETKTDVVEEFSSADDNSEEDYDDDGAEHLEIDFGHLAAFNTNPLSEKLMNQTAKREDYLRETATANVDIILEKICALAKNQSSISTVQLPKPITKLPRQKPIPEPKQETKWDKFAKEKGVQNKKRERMVWDDETQTWKPRWGHKRINDEQSEWVVEVKAKDDPTVDQFHKKRSDKKLRVLKNRQKELRNLDRNSKSKPLPAGIANDLTSKGRGEKGKGKGKQRTEQALKAAQTSTASLGRFDAEIAGEPKRKIGNKRRNFRPNEKLNDRERDSKVLARILGKPLNGLKMGSAESGRKLKKRRK